MTAAALFSVLFRLFRSLGSGSDWDDGDRSAELDGGLFLGDLSLRLLLQVLCALCLAAEDGYLVRPKRLYHKLVRIVNFDPHRAFQKVHVDHRALAGGSVDEGIHLRHELHELLVGVLLIFKAAHKPAAGSGDLCGVEGKALSLRHFYADGLEIIEKLGAAERPAADAETAKHTRLIADADLPKLDAGLEHPGEILDELAEVDAAVRGEEEQDLVPLKIKLHVNELHLKIALFDFALADGEGLSLLRAVFGGAALVLFGGEPDDGAQGGANGGVVHLVIARYALGKLKPLRRLHDETVALLRGHSGRVEEIHLALIFKSYANNFSH